MSDAEWQDDTVREHALWERRQLLRKAFPSLFDDLCRPHSVQQADGKTQQSLCGVDGP